MSTSFGRYKVAEELGRGAMGVVYRAVDPAIGRSVAIKAINRSYLESLGVRPEEYAERFQREAQVAGALNHPHIVKIFDLGPDYLVMEYVEGQTLAALLRARGRVTQATALRMLGQAAAALDHAHASGIVHRDIKPANVMVQPDGSVKVMDFGLARIESSTLTAAGEVLGSAAYMAPEVVLGQPADARSDNFSLAIVAYELFTGVRPFAGPTVSAIIQSVVRTSPRPVRELDASLPPEVDAVFARALAKEPGQRYALAGDFARALAAAPWTSTLRAGGPVDVGADTDPGTATIVLATASTIVPADETPSAADVTTILTVDAEELAEPGEPPAVADPPAAVEKGAAATAILSAPAAAEPPAAPPAEPSSATVILEALVAEPSESEPAATVILRAPAGPEPAPASQPEEPAATVVLKAPPGPPPATADATAVGQRPFVPPAPPAGANAVPPAGPEDPTLVKAPAWASRSSARPVPPAPEPSATVSVTADALAADTVAAASPAPQPASTSGVPAAPPSTPPPAVPPAAVAPPSAPPTPPLPTAAPAGAPAAARAARPPAPPPLARRATPVGWIVGVVALILLLFGAAVAGFFWLVRSQNAKDAAASPAPATETAPPPPEEAVPPAPPVTSAAEAPAPEAPAAETAPSAAATQPATLVVASDPAGATVTIGRRTRGRTPLRLSVPPGTAAVVVEKEGFKPWRESARLKPGETRTLQAQLEPLAPPRAAPTAAPAPPAKPAVSEGDLVTAGPDVTPPRKLSGDSPVIPDKIRRRLSGSAVVEFVVGIDGRVSDPKVVDSINLVVDQAVLDAVATWRYEPARSHGVRVRVVQRAKFTFVSR